MRKQAWFICIIAIAAVIPGMLLGGIAAIIYRLMTGYEIGRHPDFFLMRTLFGIDTPGQIVEWIFFSAFPLTIHGIVAGAFAMFVASLVSQHPNHALVAGVTGGIYTGIMIVAYVFTLVVRGFDQQILESACQVIGLWIGLFFVAEALPAPRQSAT